MIMENYIKRVQAMQLKPDNETFKKVYEKE